MPAVTAYAWVTLPSNNEDVMQRSRMSLLYDKFFGINGQVMMNLG